MCFRERVKAFADRTVTEARRDCDPTRNGELLGYSSYFMTLKSRVVRSIERSSCRLDSVV